MKLSEKIITLRKANGMTQEELAEKLEVSRQAVSRWESGTAMPDANNILQISKLFRVTTDYLLHEDYRSDEDVPKVKVARKEYHELLLVFLVGLEVVTLLLQIMTTFLLQNAVFSFMTLLPFAALVAGFEYGYRKRSENADEKAKVCRRRFYKSSIWLGLYFPIRFVVSAAVRFWPRPYSALVLECGIFALYLCTALILTHAVNRMGSAEK